MTIDPCSYLEASKEDAVDGFVRRSLRIDVIESSVVKTELGGRLGGLDTDSEHGCGLFLIGHLVRRQSLSAVRLAALFGHLVEAGQVRDRCSIRGLRVHAD